MKKIIRIIIAITVVFLIGGCSKVTGSPSKEEMIRIVKSEEAKEAIEETLKNLDKDALTDKGIIKSYEVDYDTVRHSPMGGINFILFINKEEELYIRATITKYNVKLEFRSGSISSKLTELLERKGNEKI